MRVEGLEALERIYSRAPGMVEREERRAMEEALLDVALEVVERTPTNNVTTGGTLRNAMMAGDAKRISGDGGSLVGVFAVANVPYVLYVEEDTRAHIIQARNGKALAFRPLQGFGLVYRDTATGKTLGKRAAAARGGVGVQIERGSAIMGRMVFRQHVHHPGTTGRHMFRDGAVAAWPMVQRRFAAAAARVAKALSGPGK